MIMVFWIIVCFLILWMGIEDGDSTMIVIFGGLFVLLVGLKVTEKLRAKIGLNLRTIIRAIIVRRKEEKLIKRANARFDNSSFAALVLRDLRQDNWDAFSDPQGCQVLPDKIITPHKTYDYLNGYGLKKLDQSGCKELATYLAQFYPGKCSIIEKIRYAGGFTGSYSSYVNSDGGVTTSPDYVGGEYWEGYIIRKVTPKQTTPQGKDW